HVDLVGADLGGDGAELGLLFRRGSAAARRRAAARRHRHRHRRRRAHAELGLERLDELRQLENRDPLDVIDNLLLIQFGHCRSPKLRLRFGLFLFAWTRTLIRSRGAAFRTLTSCTIGAWSRKRSFAYSSGFPGSEAS